jgi:hypothetical protein
MLPSNVSLIVSADARNLSVYKGRVHAMAQPSYGRLDVVFVMRAVLMAWCSRHGCRPNSLEAKAAALKILDLMQDRRLTRKDLLALLDQNPPSH